ncbi:unnamed protein product [Coccothraustes coccothraustes]
MRLSVPNCLAPGPAALPVCAAGQLRSPPVHRGLAGLPPPAGPRGERRDELPPRGVSHAAAGMRRAPGGREEIRFLPECGDMFGAYGFKPIIQAEVLAVQLFSSMHPSFFSLG